VLSTEDYTSEEIQKSWYGKAELKSFKRDILVTLQLNRAGKLVGVPNNDREEQLHTMRGLEGRTREGCAAKKALKASAQAATLGEQSRQLACGSRNAELLALVAQKASSESQHEAYIMGMYDELVVQDEYAHGSTTIAHQKLSSPTSVIRLKDYVVLPTLSEAGQAA